MKIPASEGGPPLVLAIDTATAAGSVALRLGERSLERGLEWRASFREVAPAIEGVMKEAGIVWEELDAVAVPRGPGSFTGLRVAASLALGLTKISGRSLYAVPTLAAVAEACAPEAARRVCATLDARRGRRYAALYERAGQGRWELLAGPVDAKPDVIEALAAGAPRIGPDLGLDAPVRIAGAIARLVAAEPTRHALASPGELELVYARSGVDGT